MTPDTHIPSNLLSDVTLDTPETLSEVIAQANALEKDLLPDAQSFNFGFLRNITIENIEPFLRYHLLADGTKPSFTYGGYGTLRQDILDTDSQLRKANVDMLACTFMLSELDAKFGQPDWSAEHVQEELRALFEELESSEIPIIALHTFLLPFFSERGLAIQKNLSDLTTEIESLNNFIVEWVRSHSPRFCLLDWNRILRRIGKIRSIDYRMWYLKKAPFKRDFLDQVAIELRTIVRAARGHAKKCLVLDCDNTLWGGIVGEDGVEGIKLDGHDYPGRIFHDFQKIVLQIANRGILVLLCSKNNEQDVLQVLDKHPWCLIKSHHLAAHRINWSDKAENIRSLAEELNLGLDSFVFVDDNPRELALVKQLLPMVTILQVPHKLHELPELLIREGWFESLSSGNEDQHRTQLYQSEALRKSEKEQYADLQSYLFSLQQTVIIHEASKAELPRVAQLTQKTNQFNLTTRRYSEYDIEQFSTDANSCIYTMTAGDRFGSLGLVGVLIAHREEKSVKIDTFLLSCRALGRELEQAFVIECMSEIRNNWSVTSWEAAYNPTAKNMQVKSFWPSLGFIPLDETDGKVSYVMESGELNITCPPHIKLDKS